MTDTASVLQEVLAERQRQESKWGQQNHPWRMDFAEPEEDFVEPLDSWFLHEQPRNADEAKELVEAWSEVGILAYCDILMEEVVEALDEPNIKKVREELIQVAAVAVAAIESIDRNGR